MTHAKSKQRLMITVAVAMMIIVSCKGSSDFSGSGSSTSPKQPSTANTSKPTTTNTPPPAVTPTPSLPLPENSIVKGSFTVWADPPNPSAGQNYEIHIRVTLPATLSSYVKTDLSGELIGTDKYYQGINGTEGNILIHLKTPAQRFSFVPNSGSAELIMPIPGAASGVNDTINVKSALLNEAQTITVHFN